MASASPARQYGRSGGTDFDSSRVDRTQYHAGAISRATDPLLLPTDFSTASAAGEEWARTLASHGVKDIVLVHVVENPLLDVYAPDMAAFDLQRLMEESRQHPPRSAKPYWEHAYGVAQEKLRSLRQQLLGAPAHASQVDIQVREGPAADSLLAIAREKAPDKHITNC